MGPDDENEDNGHQNRNITEFDADYLASVIDDHERKRELMGNLKTIEKLKTQETTELFGQGLTMGMIDEDKAKDDIFAEMEMDMEQQNAQE